MLVKAPLATKVSEIIKRRKLTQIQAAELLGIPQPTLSNMLRGQFRDIFETKMIDCLTRLGRNVEMVVKVAPRSKTAGLVSVVFS
jgi:predicted XRE-type DNA-binding protein